MLLLRKLGKGREKVYTYTDQGKYEAIGTTNANRGTGELPRQDLRRLYKQFKEMAYSLFSKKITWNGLSEREF